MNDHPPIGTPLSAFTPEMLERLPVGSAFGDGLVSSKPVVRLTKGWAFGSVDDPATGFENAGVEWDPTRPLIRVGPERAAEPVTSADPGPLPDPWPGYLVLFDFADTVRCHAIRDSATTNGRTVFCPVGGFREDVYLDWTPEVVREVRTATGEVLWRRA